MTLKQQAFSAGRWTVSSTILITALQFLQTIILARLLTPADFGLMAVTASLLAVFTLFADLGLSRAIIHHNNIPSDTLSSLYWLNIIVSLLLMLILVGGAPMLGILFKTPDIAPVLQTASLVFPLTALGQQFRTLAEKGLRFDVLVANEIAAAIAGFSAAIVVAANGGNVYALVAGVLFTAATSSLLAFLRLSHGHRPSWHLRLNAALPYLRFGGYMVGENLASTLNRQADIFIGGYIANPSFMGAFSLPRDFSLRIAQAINPILTRVGFPVMTQVKHDKEKLKSIYLQTLRITASINFPIYMALAFFSHEIVTLLFGPQWVDSAIYLQVFAAFGLLRSISNPIGSLLYAVGMAQRAFWWNLALLLIFPSIFLLGASLNGLLGLAYSMLFSQLFVIVPVWCFLVRPACGASLWEYVHPLSPPFFISLFAGMVAHIATMSFENAVMRLLISFGLGAVVYFTLSIRFNRPWIGAMRELFQFSHKP